MTNTMSYAAILAVVATVGGCASLPTGPSAMALPGSGKNFEQFRGDDYDCRQYANFQAGGKGARDGGVNSMAGSAAIGAGIGALAGAAIGGHQGAGAGAGAGLITGTMVGAESAEYSSYGAQTRYDHAYIQCMYAKGHRVPVSGQFMTAPNAPAPAPIAAPAPVAAPATAQIPPPPAGLPPPPPPNVKSR